MHDVLVVRLRFNGFIEVCGTPRVFRYHSRSGAADSIGIRAFRQNQIPNVFAEAIPFLLRGFVRSYSEFYPTEGASVHPDACHCALLPASRSSPFARRPAACGGQT